MRCFIETTKSEPLQSCSSEGVLLCLLALMMALKPLADVVGHYICSDSHEETGDYRLHQDHLPSVARMGKGSVTSIT